MGQISEAAVSIRPGVVCPAGHRGWFEPILPREVFWVCDPAQRAEINVATDRVQPFSRNPAPLVDPCRAPTDGPIGGFPHLCLRTTACLTDSPGGPSVARSTSRNKTPFSNGFWSGSGDTSAVNGPSAL